MARSNIPIILDKKVLDEGLHSLFSSFASDLSAEFSLPAISDADIDNICASLSSYLKHFVGHNLRSNIKPLRPKDLEFQIFRSRNPSEEYQDEQGTWVKGEKKWYRLVLYETTTTVTKAKGKKKESKEIDVQILAEGEMRLKKAEILEGFEAAVKKKVEAWEDEEIERDRRVRKAQRAKREEMKGKKESMGKGNAKAKKRAKDEKDGEDEEPVVGIGEDVGAEDGWGMKAVDEFDQMAYKAKKKPASEGGASRKSALKAARKSTKSQSTGKKRHRSSSGANEDVYGYNSDSGEYEGIRVKRRGKNERVRFADEELGGEDGV